MMAQRMGSVDVLRRVHLIGSLGGLILLTAGAISPIVQGEAAILPRSLLWLGWGGGLTGLALVLMAPILSLLLHMGFSSLAKKLSYVVAAIAAAECARLWAGGLPPSWGWLPVFMGVLSGWVSAEAQQRVRLVAKPDQRSDSELLQLRAGWSPHPAAERAIEAETNGEWAVAVEYWRQTVEDSPEDIQALLGLARCLGRLDRTGETKVVLDRLSLALEGVIEHLLEQDMEQHAWDRASRNAVALAAISPGNTSLAESATRLLEAERVAAISILLQLIEGKGGDPKILWLRFRRHLEVGEARPALDIIEKIVALGDRGGSARLARIQLLASLGRRREAILLAREACDQLTGINLRTARGHLAQLREKYDGAIEVWQSLLRDGDDPAWRAACAECYCALGDFDQADLVLVGFERAAARRETALAWAHVAELRGDPAVAAGRWQSLVAVRPDCAFTHAGYATFLMDGEALEEAQTVLTHYATEHGWAIPIERCRAVLYAKRGDMVSAVRLFAVLDQQGDLSTETQQGLDALKRALGVDSEQVSAP